MTNWSLNLIRDSTFPLPHCTKPYWCQSNGSNYGSDLVFMRAEFSYEVCNYSFINVKGIERNHFRSAVDIKWTPKYWSKYPAWVHIQCKLVITANINAMQKTWPFIHKAIVYKISHLLRGPSYCTAAKCLTPGILC